jgi:predicted ester cyclase
MEKPNRIPDQMTRVRNKNIAYQMVDDFRHLTSDGVDEYLDRYYEQNTRFTGFHPFDEINGRKAVADEFLKPYLVAFPDARKHVQFLFGGESDGQDWVVIAGNLVGNFSEKWLDIPPSHQTTWVRFVEFLEFQDGKVVRSAMIIDLLSLLRQAGYLFVDPGAPEIITPGPETNDGILLGETDPLESLASRKMCEAAIGRGAMMLRRAKTTAIPDDIAMIIMRLNWHEDMMWYGPDGAGTTKGIYDYLAKWELPWELTMTGVKNGDQLALVAEDKFVCWGGFPNLSAKHTGSEVLGIPASDKIISIRNANIFCCEGEFVLEQWCLFDMVDLLNQLGVDVLKQIREGTAKRKVAVLVAS